MLDHNIRFKGVIWKIIPVPLLISSFDFNTKNFTNCMICICVHALFIFGGGQIKQHLPTRALFPSKPFASQLSFE